jgi:hypothetical protein
VEKTNKETDPTALARRRIVGNAVAPLIRIGLGGATGASY